MGRRSYAVHRWLGAVVGFQLLLWSIGGFIFATHDIDWVRGHRGRADTTPIPLPFSSVSLTPQAAGAAAGVTDPFAVSLRNLLGKPVYKVDHAGGTTLVDASSGVILSPLSEAMATTIARNDREQATEVLGAAYIESSPPVEYRDGPLPAWKVALAGDDNLKIYIDANTGTISARRNDAWRRFDFFWMLHTMDYSGRDNFNNPLLMVFAILGIVSVLSGATLWGLRLRRRQLRNRKRAVRQAINL